jgi:hypothetical protein
MALLDSEIARIKWHLGYNVLSVGAEPYFGYVSIFDQVIQPYVTAGAKTTSATTVTAASTPTPVTLTLASATGFESYASVIVDVDSRQERATVQSVSGSTITLILSNAHSGTYPVAVEGPESIVRDVLSKCDAAWSAYSEAIGNAGLKQLGQGEIEWFQEGSGNGALSSARATLMNWRRELGNALGLPPAGSGGSSRCELY